MHDDKMQAKKDWTREWLWEKRVCTSPASYTLYFHHFILWLLGSTAVRRASQIQESTETLGIWWHLDFGKTNIIDSTTVPQGKARYLYFPWQLLILPHGDWLSILRTTHKQSPQTISCSRCIFVGVSPTELSGSCFRITCPIRKRGVFSHEHPAFSSWACGLCSVINSYLDFHGLKHLECVLFLKTLLLKIQCCVFLFC